jgi:hypothetical protein
MTWCSTTLALLVRSRAQNSTNSRSNVVRQRLLGLLANGNLAGRRSIYRRQFRENCRLPRCQTSLTRPFSQISRRRGTALGRMFGLYEPQGPSAPADTRTAISPRFLVCIECSAMLVWPLLFTNGASDCAFSRRFLYGTRIRCLGRRGTETRGE